MTLRQAAPPVAVDMAIAAVPADVPGLAARFAADPNVAGVTVREGEVFLTLATTDRAIAATIETQLRPLVRTALRDIAAGTAAATPIGVKG